MINGNGSEALWQKNDNALLFFSYKCNGSDLFIVKSSTAYFQSRYSKDNFVPILDFSLICFRGNHAYICTFVSFLSTFFYKFVATICIYMSKASMQ